MQLREPLARAPGRTPVVLATGGFQAAPRLVEQHVTPQAAELLLRAAPGAPATASASACSRRHDESAGMDEFYGRNMPAPPARVEEPADFVRARPAVRPHATVAQPRRRALTRRDLVEIDVVQWTARQPGARAWYEVPDANRRMSACANARSARSSTAALAARRARRPPRRRDDDRGRRRDHHHPRRTADRPRTRRPRPGVYAAGADAGGIATGGYASGLAAALVFGRIAADAALGLGRDLD